MFKKVAIAAVAALMLTSAALADGNRHGGYNGNSGNGNVGAALVIGSILGYAISQSQRQPVYIEPAPVYVQPPPIVYYEPPVNNDYYRSQRYLDEPRERIVTPHVYEDRYLWDPEARVWRRVTVQIR
jgi:hypothetical protein